jgi:G protein beta subunit-like protein
VPDGDNAIRCISVSPDASKVVAANNTGKCFIWKLGDRDTSRFEPHHKMEAHKNYILKCLFSPDSRFDFLLI